MAWSTPPNNNSAKQSETPCHDIVENAGCALPVTANVPNTALLELQTAKKALNYLGAGYKIFFTHSAPYRRFMVEQLLDRRPPAIIREWLRQQESWNAQRGRSLVDS